MKQRLAIASAMLNNPEVLILDEPTNGLDPEGIIQIRDIINNIAKQGITIIIASHLLDEIEKICSHVIVLKEEIPSIAEGWTK
jgi:ABC-2 type transport system ATP-binding protein